MSAARAVAAVLAGHAAFGLAFLAAGLGRAPVPLYAPLERRLLLAAPAEAPPGLWMAWFGATGFAFVAALAAGALAWALLGRGERPSRARAAAALARAALLTMLVTYAYFGVTLLRQTPAPLPLPSWYCPR